MLDEIINPFPSLNVATIEVLWMGMRVISSHTL